MKYCKNILWKIAVAHELHRGKLLLLLSLFALLRLGGHVVGCTAPASLIQQGPGRGPITTPRDPELEKQSAHNLEVARYYFYKRKPDRKNDKEGWARLNKAVKERLMEIIDLNPTFARADDVYFMLGEVHWRSGEPEQAVEYWTKAVKETSDEKLKADAQKRLDEAKASNKDQTKKG